MRGKIQATHAQNAATVEIALDWLLMLVDGTSQANFTIDRSETSCKTPTRNCMVQAAEVFHRNLLFFANQALFMILSCTGGANSNLLSIRDNGMTIPIFPLVELQKTDDNRLAMLLTVEDLDKIMINHEKDLRGTIQKLTSSFAQDTGSTDLISIYFALFHLQHLCFEYLKSLDYMENLLCFQFFSSIGKIVSVQDMADFMNFNNRNLFLPQFSPRQFTYPVQYKETHSIGTFSMERRFKGGNSQPIEMFCCELDSLREMSLIVRDDLQFTTSGRKTLHSWVRSDFKGEEAAGEQIQLSVRAKQFSSFVVMLGEVSSENFKPSHAIVVKNKDDVLIPFLIDGKDPSSQQKAQEQHPNFFAAFQQLQKHNQLMGICILHIKPLIERSFRLQEGSLAKDLSICEDLLELAADSLGPSFISLDNTLCNEDKLIQMNSQITELRAKKNSQKFSSNTHSRGHSSRVTFDKITLPLHQSLPTPGDETLALSREVQEKLNAEFPGVFFPSTVHPAPTWERNRQANLFSKPQREAISTIHIQNETETVFRLLKLLSQSGEIRSLEVDLHIVLTNTHSFEDSVFDCITKGNQNPIEILTRSTIAVASSIHKLPPEDVVNPNRA